MVVTRQTVHHLILHMDKQSFIDLAVGIRRDAEIMRIGIAIIRVEIAIQVIDATHAHFPGTENAIPHLWRDAKVEVIPIKAQSKSPPTVILPFMSGTSARICAEALPAKPRSIKQRDARIAKRFISMLFSAKIQ